MGARDIMSRCALALIFVVVSGARATEATEATLPVASVASDAEPRSVWSRRLRMAREGEPAREVDDYHYVFSADCKPYMEWQSVALYYSWMAAGAPGQFTRLLSCDEPNYPYVNSVPTHVTPLYTNIDPKDPYSAYNLPGSMMHWTQHNSTDRKWVIKLDADMIIRKPLSVLDGLEAEEGLVAAGIYGYLSGVDNEMAPMFVPADVVPRLAKVGGWEIFWHGDLVKAAPLWFEYTKRVRQDPRAWWPFKGTGDVYVSRESPRPWISEMYGYVFGTAMAGLRHNVEPSAQLYAGMSPWDQDSFDPFLIHYGLKIEIGDWVWDKHFELQGSAHKDKLNCELPYYPFPMVPRKHWPGSHHGMRYDPGTAEARRVEIVMELMMALNKGIRAWRRVHCGEPWPAGLSSKGLEHIAGDVVDDHAEHRAKGDGHEFQRRALLPREKSQAELQHIQHVQRATTAKVGEAKVLGEVKVGEAKVGEAKSARVVGGRRAGGGFKGRNVREGMANTWLWFSFGWGLVLTVLARYLFCPPTTGKPRRKGGRVRRHEIPNKRR